VKLLHSLLPDGRVSGGVQELSQLEVNFGQAGIDRDRFAVLGDGSIRVAFHQLLMRQHLVHLR
jgi:hypothetical protein